MEKYNFTSDLLTNISIDKKSCTPKYLQLANSILDVVESGDQKARCTTSRVYDGFAGLGVYERHDQVERARRPIVG